MFRGLFGTRVRGGILGDFSITPTGDTTERRLERSGRLVAGMTIHHAKGREWIGSA